MSVLKTQIRDTQTSQRGRSTYGCNFFYTDPADIKIRWKAKASSTYVNQVINIDYFLIPEREEKFSIEFTGQVNHPDINSPEWDGGMIKIDRSTPHTQPVGITKGQPIPEASLEEMPDRLTRILQEVADGIVAFGVISTASGSLEATIPHDILTLLEGKGITLKVDKNGLTIGLSADAIVWGGIGGDIKKQTDLQAEFKIRDDRITLEENTRKADITKEANERKQADVDEANTRRSADEALERTKVTANDGRLFMTTATKSPDVNKQGQAVYRDGTGTMRLAIATSQQTLAHGVYESNNLILVYGDMGAYNFVIESGSPTPQEGEIVFLSEKEAGTVTSRPPDVFALPQIVGRYTSIKRTDPYLVDPPAHAKEKKG